MVDESLGMQLSKWLIEKRPGLLACDREATKDVGEALADILGCTLATVLARGGETAYLTGLRSLMKRVDDNARSTLGIAESVTSSTEGSSKQ